MHKYLTAALVALPMLLAGQQKVGVNTISPIATLHVIGQTSGEPGLRVSNEDGDAAILRVEGTANEGAGLKIFNEGVGRALNIQTMSATNPENMLFLYNNGLGRGFELIQNNTSNDTVAALIFNSGTSDALQVNNANVLNTKPTGSFFHNGEGLVLSAVHQNTSNTTSSVYVANQSSQTSFENDGMGAFVQTESLRGGYFLNKGTGNNSAGIYGRNEGGGTGAAAGVVGSAGGIDSIFAIFGFGDIAGASKSFLIDHPLDPANKMLKHFSVESDEPMLIYRGKATLNEKGEAIVQLKDYQDAILQNVTYNITAIGSPVIAYIDRELDTNGQFIIVGNLPGATINWTLYGERADAYFEYYSKKKQVEIPKTGDAKGKYFYPEAHGKSKVEGLDQSYFPREN